MQKMAAFSDWPESASASAVMKSDASGKRTAMSKKDKKKKKTDRKNREITITQKDRVVRLDW